MKKHIPTIAALLMMFVFGYVCPTWSTVTPVGLKVLGAFIGWLILVIAGKGMVIASCLAFLHSRSAGIRLRRSCWRQALAAQAFCSSSMPSC